MSPTILHILSWNDLSAAKQIRALQQFPDQPFEHQTLIVGEGVRCSEIHSLLPQSFDFAVRFQPIDIPRLRRRIQSHDVERIHLWPVQKSIASWITRAIKNSAPTVVTVNCEPSALPHSMAKVAARLVSPSQWITTELSGSGAAAVHIPWCVSSPAGDVESQRETLDNPRVVTFTDFGFSECLKEMMWSGSMLEQVTSFGWTLFGDGESRPAFEEYRDRVQVRSDTTRFAGIQKDAERVFSQANLCWGSHRRAHSSLGMHEAMAAGLPVITFDHPVQSEILGIGTESVCGRMVDGSSVSYARSTLRLLEDPPRYAAFSEAARAMIQSSNLPSNVIPKYIEMYQSLD